MPTAASAKQAVAALRDLTVGIPGPLDPETGEAKIIFSFTISAMLHNPQMRNQGHGASDIRSHAQRVTVDTTRALELAELLDDEREVPETSRLHSIFKESTVESALKKPTDKLDVAVAYLRRVHFVMFYTGKRFRDEAHMLSLAPSIIHRSAHYIPDPAVSFSPAPPAGPPPKPLGQPPAKSQAVVDATLPDDNKNEESTAAEDVPSDVLTTTEISSTEEAVDQSVGEKRKREEDEEESFSKAVKVNDDGYNVDNKSEKEEDGEDNEQQVASPDKGKSGGGNRQFTQRAVGNGYRRKVPLSDR